MGFAGSKKEARQLVRHGHMLVNGKKVNIPSYLLKAGDVVELREKSRSIAQIQQTLAAVEKRGFPAWLEIDKAQFGKSSWIAARDECTLPTVKSSSSSNCIQSNLRIPHSATSVYMRSRSAFHHGRTGFAVHIVR
jgi:ribosomal protein S4